MSASRERITGTASGKDARFLLASFSVGHLAIDWAICAIWIIAPAMALDMGLSPAQLGALFAIQSIGASLAFFPSGMLSDHVRNRGRLLSITFWWVAIGFFFASFAPGYWSFAVVLALAGLGDAAWHPIATGVLIKQMPRRRGEALGVHAIGGSLASVLAPLVVGYLLAVMDWRDALRISVIPAVLMGVLFVTVIARRVPLSTDNGITRADLRDFFSTWASRPGVRLLAVVVSYNMAVMALMSMTPLFLQVRHGYSSAQAGTVFAAALLVGTLMQPVIGRISDRIGRRWVFGNVVLAGCVFSAGIALAAPGVALVATIILALGVLSGVRAVLLAMAVDFASRREGTTLGFVFAIMDGMGAFGALLAGAVAEFDLRNAFFLAAALALISALLVIVHGGQRAGSTPRDACPPSS